MLYLWPGVNILLHLILLIFTGMSVSLAFSRARVHLAWLIPMALGWAFQLVGGLCNLAFMAVLRSGGYARAQWNWLLVPQQALYLLGMLCLLWAVIALFFRLQATLPESLPTAQTVSENTGAWPPPPTPPG